MKKEVPMTKASPTLSGSEAAGNTNRSSSEINAATDLVGIGGVPPTSNIKIENTEGEKPDDDGNKADSKITAEGGDNIDKEPKGLGEDVVPADAKDAVAVAMGNDDDVEKEEGEKTAFPVLLHEIVTDPDTDDCIHWLTCGTRFMISDKKKFADEILPRFYGHAKFTSFTRRLKRWSFTRVPSGPFMGSYHNPNFRRGEPELAARVRYDHPAQLSASAMQLSKQQLKLQAAAGVMGMGGIGALGGMFGGNPLLGAGQMHQLSNEDREMLLRQMNLMNGAGGGNMMGMSGLGGIDSLYRAMGQNNAQGNPLGGMNSSALLQMAMAQEVMQQRQQNQLGQIDQARLMAQQQLQQQWNNPNMSTMLNSAAQGQQQGGQGGQTPEDQRMLASMFLEHLNKQQQQQQQQQQQHLPGQSNLSNLQQQFNFASQGGGGGGSGPNTSMGSTTNIQQHGQQMSLMSMMGGNGDGGGGNSGSINWGNNDSMGQTGGGGGGGGLSGNPMGMSALLADYLRRAGGAPPNGGGGGDGENMVKEEGGNNMTEAFC